MARRIVWVLAVALSFGCTAAQTGPHSDAPEDEQRVPDLGGTWRGRLSLYSPEINDLRLELQLAYADGERVGRAEIEVTDEPGELHHYETGLFWERNGAAVIIHIGENTRSGSSGLTFEGTLVGEDQIIGRLDGRGIRKARFTLRRQEG